MKKDETVEGLLTEIKDHASTITEQIYTSKRVDSLPNLPFELRLSEGWRSKLLSADSFRDIWIKTGSAGAELPEHFHPEQQEVATVIEGSCQLVMEGETHTIGIGESKIIEAGIPHKMIACAECECKVVVIYQPPLSNPEI